MALERYDLLALRSVPNDNIAILSCSCLQTSGRVVADIEDALRIFSRKEAEEFAAIGVD